MERGGGAEGGGAVCACTFSLVCYRDCARFTLCAIGMCAKGTWAIGNCVQFFVCYWVGALSHRALTDPAQNSRGAFAVMQVNLSDGYRGDCHN